MKKLVNRGNRKQYNPERYMDLMQAGAESDRMASYILACNYSRRVVDRPKAQSLIQMDCVAVCFVGSEIWVASNCRKLTEEDINNALGDVYNGWTVYRVSNGNGCMHAEMQLIKELREASLLDKVTYIGVSKPCCKHCKEVLDDNNKGYLCYHTDPVSNWEAPW